MSIKPPFTDVDVTTQDAGFYKGHSLPIALISKSIMVALVLWALVVPANAWQTATSLGAWTLVGCTVAPGFEFSGFEMAPSDWRPTPRMLQRNPEWPSYIPPGPDNPLGTHALYLSWQYYRIHGTHDTRKIGRRSSNGCIGLYNEHIAELFSLTRVGTQVLLI